MVYRDHWPLIFFSSVDFNLKSILNLAVGFILSLQQLIFLAVHLRFRKKCFDIKASLQEDWCLEIRK